jgi:hypothetical protein
MIWVDGELKWRINEVYFAEKWEEAKRSSPKLLNVGKLGNLAMIEAAIYKVVGISELGGQIPSSKVSEETLTDQCFKKYTKPDRIDINLNTEPELVVATFIAAAQYEVTNGRGWEYTAIAEYFNPIGPGKGSSGLEYNFGAVNLMTDTGPLKMTSVTLDLSGTTEMINSPDLFEVNKRINNAFDCRDSAWGPWLRAGYLFDQFTGMPFGSRLPIK